MGSREAEATPQRRARKGEFVNRVPQAALDEISLMLQEQREQIDHGKARIARLEEALREMVAHPKFESDGKGGVVYYLTERDVQNARKLLQSEEE